MKTIGIVIGTLLFMVSALPLAMAQPASNARLFDQMDTNGDGVVSEQEWHAAMQKRFESIDKNRDGNLSAAEWQEMKDSLRERFGSRKGGRFR